MAAALCELGGRFSRCPNPPDNACQYCGRNFCAAHTHYVEGHEAVCSRKPCREKKQDMDLHLAYRARVGQLNRARLCGEESCGSRPIYECSLCRGLFCDSHLSDRMYPFHDGRVVVDKPASVCSHCWDRRKIWRRG
jgi:hypothetical protein